MSGNMFHVDNIGPVTRNELEIIINDLESRLGHHGMFANPSIRERTLGSSSMCLDGQLGKKDIMGDIDIAVSKSSGDEAIDLATIEELLKKSFPTMEVRARASLKIVSLLYQLRSNHNVQVDFILGDYEVLKFMFASPDPSHRTEYNKGFYRNFYISALTQSLREVINEDGIPVAFAGPKLDRHKGITFEYRHHPKKKNGSGRVKQIKKITKEEFKKLYGRDIRLPVRALVNPYEIIDYFFPKSTFNVDEYDTVEAFRLAISENYSAEMQQNIEKRFKEILETSK
ncbi:MAG: hypothetical protein M0R77_02395 [Gammaproteobacteria bacterium]|nr:hypothetical protein [Gammaproteobacteria bacterium]